MVDEQVITATTQGSAPAQSAGLTHDPIPNAPNLEDKSESELADMLAQTNQSGGQQAPVSAPIPGALDDPAQPGEGQPQVKPVEIPEKFRNADGTMNQEAMIKSQSDGQAYSSQVKNEMAELQKQFATQAESMKSMQSEYQQWQAEQAEAEEVKNLSDEEIKNLTPDQLRQHLADRDAKVEKTIDQKLAKLRESQNQDSLMNAAIAKAKADLPQFKENEQAINDIMNKNELLFRPESVALAYNAYIGSNVGKIVTEAKNVAYSDGYAKAKTEMGLHVEAGGKASTPADGLGFSTAQIDGMSLQELERLIPRHSL